MNGIVEAELRKLDEHGINLRLAKETWSEIPPDTRKALAKKWVLEAANFIDTKATQYPAEKQAEERQRIIPLPAALNALQNLEAELVRTQILDLGDIMWKRYKVARELFRAMNVSWNNVWKIAQLLWASFSSPTADELRTAVDELLLGIATCGALVGEIVSAKAFVATALSVMHERDKCVAELRRKAFPQARHARRWRVRKKAR